MPMNFESASPIRPIQAILDSDTPGVLAVIKGTEGPSYRPVGAMMAVFGDASRIGSLSSGCVESDIGTHAVKALETGSPAIVKYGLGSPFFDIELPCGGGLEILLLPQPDRALLTLLATRYAARQLSVLQVEAETGAMDLLETGDTGMAGGKLRVRFEPQLQFCIFGKGPEAVSFAALVQSVGYSGHLISPDEETLAEGRASGCSTTHIVAPGVPQGCDIDDRTAVIAFFHDHDWEPPILSAALDSPAFYIGAQGSLRASEQRLQAMRDMGVTEAQLARVTGPVGLIPSARDPVTLAVSVLAEVLAVAGTGA